MIKLYAKDENYTLFNGNMLEMDKVITPNSIDAIITDPPYEIGFMNKSWDKTGIAFKKETWEKCLKVLKPGGYLLAFGGTRTFHRITCAIEDAGFEIRDVIMWLYATGFPKSNDVGLQVDKKLGKESKVIGRKQGSWTTGKKSDETHSFILSKQHDDATIDVKVADNEWKGYGTCLKPAYEPIIVARKPFKTTLVENILKYRTGGVNIGECRIGDESFEVIDGEYDNKYRVGFGNCKRTPKEYVGRFPANVIVDENVARELGDHTKCFMTIKATTEDREQGLDDFEALIESDRKKLINVPFNRSGNKRKNIHPTVKPTELMRYLVRLYAPKKATILDCFMGSGSTGKAVMLENNEREADYKFIGIELTDRYLPIAKARIDYGKNQMEQDIAKEKYEKDTVSLFDFSY